MKTTSKMRWVKSRSAEGVGKEMAIYCLVYHLVHAVMTKAAGRKNTTPDRISFVDTIRWLLTPDPDAALADLVANPCRPGRDAPRVVKDLHDTYRKMTKPRKQARKRLELAER